MGLRARLVTPALIVGLLLASVPASAAPSREAAAQADDPVTRTIVPTELRRAIALLSAATASDAFIRESIE